MSSSRTLDDAWSWDEDRPMNYDDFDEAMAAAQEAVPVVQKAAGPNVDRQPVGAQPRSDSVRPSVGFGVQGGVDRPVLGLPNVPMAQPVAALGGPNEPLSPVKVELQVELQPGVKVMEMRNFMPPVAEKKELLVKPPDEKELLVKIKFEELKVLRAKLWPFMKNDTSNSKKLAQDSEEALRAALDLHYKLLECLGCGVFVGELKKTLRGLTAWLKITSAALQKAEDAGEVDDRTPRK